MMEKKIFYDRNALKELKNFKKEVQKEFQAYIEVLRREGRLEFPEARKIKKNLYEIRLRKEGLYRGLYAYIWRGYIVILHFFQKKTKKTPRRNIKTAEGRLRRYE